jgi:molecular chaperone HtpG
MRPDQDAIYYVTGESREAIEASPHIEAFRDKGWMSRLLENVPVFVVDESTLALRGAARRAIALFESGWQRP